MSRSTAVAMMVAKVGLLDWWREDQRTRSEAEMIGIYARAQEEAFRAVAAIVAACGGEVRVPDSLLVSGDLVVHVSPATGETVYRVAALRPTQEEVR